MDDVHVLSELPSQAGSRQSFTVPHLGDIGLVGVLAVLRGGTNIYKYTTASGGHRRHLRHFQIRGADEEEAIAWRNASWISIRKERMVYLRNVLSVHYGHGDLASLGEAHPGSAMVDADRCFSVKYLDSPSGDNHGGSVRYLHLCAQTSGDFSTWRRGLQALLAQRQQLDPKGALEGIYSTNTSGVSSDVSNLVSHGYSEKSHMSSTAESQATASTIQHNVQTGGTRGRQAEEDTYDARVKLIHNAYDANPRVQTSVVKLQALVRGFRTRATSSKALDWAWDSLAPVLQSEDTGDFDDHGDASPRHGMVSPRTSDLEENWRYGLLPDGPEDLAQSGPVIMELRRARGMHKRVESWAHDEEDRITLLTKRLHVLLDSDDAPGHDELELAKLSSAFDAVTQDLIRSAQQLEHLCGVDQQGGRVRGAETGASSLFDCQQDTKAAERKLQAYDRHLSSVLEPALARISKDIERIRVRATDNCEELARFERELDSRPAPADGHLHHERRTVVRAFLFTLVLVFALLLAHFRPAWPGVSHVFRSPAAALEACRLEVDVVGGRSEGRADGKGASAVEGAEAVLTFDRPPAAVAREGFGTAHGVERVVGWGADDATDSAATSGGAGGRGARAGSLMGEGLAIAEAALAKERAGHEPESVDAEDTLVRGRARAALERERVQLAEKKREEARLREQTDIAALFPDLLRGGVYAESLVAFIGRLQASLLSRVEGQQAESV